MLQATNSVSVSGTVSEKEKECTEVKWGIYLKRLHICFSHFAYHKMSDHTFHNHFQELLRNTVAQNVDWCFGLLVFNKIVSNRKH